MAFREIMEQIKYAQGLSDRYKLLDCYERMYEGTFYDHLMHPFQKEFDGLNHVPLDERRPSVQFNIPYIICTQVASLMWANEQTPKVMAPGVSASESANVEKVVENLINTLGLDFIMLEATPQGQFGSVAIIVRAKKNGMPSFEVVPGKNVMPVFDKYDPDELVSLVQVYHVDGTDLITTGYIEDAAGEPIVDRNLYWMRTELDAQAETRFKPLVDADFQNLGGERKDGSIIKWEEDQAFEHDFGIVPAVWIRNLVSARSRGIDGPCTFQRIVDLQVEIDRLVSQIGRGLKFTADPMLVITGNGGPVGARSLGSASAPVGTPEVKAKRDHRGNIIKSPDKVVTIPDGDAKFLEITGQGLNSARELALMLREWALEVLGGMKSSAANQGAVQSGRALEILYMTLEILVKMQRIAYGDRGLIPLLRIILKGMETNELSIPGIEPINAEIALRLKWPNWITPSGSELLAFAQAMETLAGGNTKVPVAIIPPDLCTEWTMNELGIPDVHSAQQAVTAVNEQMRADRLAEAPSNVPPADDVDTQPN